MFCMYSAMKKNIASIANDTMNATKFAPRNDFERKNVKSTIGSALRRSAETNATVAATETPSSARIAGELQPHELPSTSATTSAPRATEIVSTPGMSTWWDEVSSRDSRVAATVTKTATIATGTLRKKIDCQETFSTRKPPTTGPMASAIALTPAHVPIALPRSWGGKALEMIDNVAGIMNAAPMPCAARPATSQASLWEKPMNALDRPNATTPKRNILRRPKMSPRRPPVTRRTAKERV